MNLDAERLNEIAQDCLRMLSAALPVEPSKGRSARTESEYLRLVHVLQQRAQTLPGGVAAAVQATASARTFQKRLAALRFHCRHLMAHCLEGRSAAKNLDWQQLSEVLPRLHEQLKALVLLKQQGMTQPRRKRRSKRLALKGLPSTWREELCARGARGKYADALLVSALTGARPGEVAKGIAAWIEYDDKLGVQTVCLCTKGIKVKAKQGQPYRFMAYSADDVHPLIAALVKRLHTTHDRSLCIQIAKAVNFTAEVQRLGRLLWRDHAHALTATCFRHQWSADVKSTGDADAASRGLGHRSARTRRHYGTAHQARGGNVLCPLRIEADLPVRALRSMPQAEARISAPE